ncbi:hypothetical protein [Streptomyces sp. NPDC058240]|uniref:hypothetical protein n=1 Tax=Streptomyces sp. NPDC058240 TaxID=3346396 RepID=UPI0036E51CD1
MHDLAELLGGQALDEPGELLGGDGREVEPGQFGGEVAAAVVGHAGSLLRSKLTFE